MRTRSTRLATGMMALGGLLCWLATPTVGQEHKAHPGAKSEPVFAPARLAERATHRRAVEAIIWGMPAVNYHLMYQEMVRKIKGSFHQAHYWSRLLRWKSQPLTQSSDVIYLMPLSNTKDVSLVVLEISPADQGLFNGGIMN